MSEVRVFVRHCRTLGYCAKGMRAFFKTHDLDWNRFLDDGIPASAFDATGDSMAIAAAQLARAEVEV